MRRFAVVMALLCVLTVTASAAYIPDEVVTENRDGRQLIIKTFTLGKAVLPQANVRSRLWDLDCIILQAVEGKLRQNQQNIKNSTAYTMAVIFNAICEAQSDLLLDPYINSLGGATRAGT